MSHTPDPSRTFAAAPNPAQSTAPPRNRWVFGVLGLCALLTAAALGALVTRLSGTKAASGPERIERSAPAVVMAVRDLSRLEGAEYHLERVVDLADKQDRLFGLLETKDAILLIASGSVIAGVDLSRLPEESVQADLATKTAFVQLPASTILSSRLDNERTYVYQRRTDILAARRESLEADARLRAEASIVEAARQGGILQRSNRNVQNTIESLLRSLGYVSIDVQFASSPQPAE